MLTCNSQHVAEIRISDWDFIGKNSSFSSFLFSSHGFLPWVTFPNVCDMIWTRYFHTFKILSFLFATFSIHENLPAQSIEQWLRFLICISVGLLLGMSPKQVLEMSSGDSNQSLAEKVVQIWYVYGMRISGCSFMQNGCDFQCTTSF